VRDGEDAFRDATGELLISRSAVLRDHRLPLSRTLKAFSPRDLSEITVEEMFLDVIFSSTEPKG